MVTGDLASTTGATTSAMSARLGLSAGMASTWAGATSAMTGFQHRAPTASLSRVSGQPASAAIQVDRGTTVTLFGRVSGGNISGWVLQLVGLPPRADFLKSSASAGEILVVNAAAGTFEVYLALADTERAQNITVELRAQVGANYYLLARHVLQINS